MKKELQSKDFRIGNYIYIPQTKTYEQIGWVEQNGRFVLKDYKSSYSSLYCLDPISLTGEWLERFGFEISGESYIIENFAIEDIDNGDKWYLYMYDEENGCDVNIGIINYVHQLQNLYFALTGEELDLKNESKP
jgi:hypothetical protein